MLIKDNAISNELRGRVGLLSSCCLGHALDPHTHPSLSESDFFRYAIQFERVRLHGNQKEVVVLKCLIFEKGGSPDGEAPIQGGVDTEINAIDTEGEGRCFQKTVKSPC